MKRPSSRAAALIAATAVTLGTTGLASAAATPSERALSGSKPAWADAAHKTRSTAGSSTVDFRVYLNYRGGDAAQRYADAVSTPGSPQYHKFLTPAQFRSRFAPAKSDVDAVKSWLTARGFDVTDVPANHKYVEAKGTADQASSAFDTSFAQYKVQGRSVRSNTSDLHVPAGLSQVQAVVGLDESQTLAVRHTTPPPPVTKTATPCSKYWGEKTVQSDPPADGTKLPATPKDWAPCGYAGKQLQGAYGMSSAIAGGNDGSGVTVGVIDAYASPTIEQDVETYSDKHGLPSIKGHFKQVAPPGTRNKPSNKKQDPQGWAGEETLDVEAVHTMAPGADITYIGAPNNYRDLDAIMNKVVDKHMADIVTNSYGYGGESLPKGYIKPSLDTQIQAASEGITLFYSSGDNGDETMGDPSATPTPDWPASSPYVTAVGGTSLGVDANNARQFELGWETERSPLAKDGTWDTSEYQYGAGGGTSRLFAQPSYQQGVVPSAISQTYGGDAQRAVPDVSALGDPTTGMCVGETQTFPDGHAAYSEYRIGGTSLASPLYAGMFALAQQKAGHAYGLANPVLYSTRSASVDITKADRDQYQGAVRPDYVNGVDDSDGITYSARWFDKDEKLTIHVRNGYDDVTGVGSPDGQAWLDAVSAK